MGTSDGAITIPSMVVGGSGTTALASEFINALPNIACDASDVLPYGANLTLPPLTSSAAGTFLTYVLETLPMQQLDGTILTGWVFDNDLPQIDALATQLNGSVSTAVQSLPVFTMQASTDSSVIETLPQLELAGVIAGGGLTALSETLPNIFLDAQADGANVLNFKRGGILPVAVTLVAEVDSGSVAALDEELPSLQNSAFAFSGNYNTLAAALPLLQTTAIAYSGSTTAADNALPQLQSLAEAVQNVSEALASSLGSPSQAWVVNLRTSALTQYDFTFNSMTLFNGKYIGASESGIVEIGTQDTDGGVPIVASARTGKHDFESAFMKRLERLYTQIATDGDMVVSTFTSEDGRRDYLLKWNQNAAIQQRRVPVGKGPKSMHWQFEISNRAGSNFRVPGMNILAKRVGRRVQ